MVGDGRAMSLREARAKRRVGEREPSKCMWCSHFGRAARKGWRDVRHIVGGARGEDERVVSSELSAIGLTEDEDNLMALEVEN